MFKSDFKVPPHKYTKSLLFHLSSYNPALHRRHYCIFSIFIIRFYEEMLTQFREEIWWP
ncbi:hypothetical protein I79_014932 [Cricetulus griseus]|uniref:Uncharacterized protein n=1 Tax=Cricetulus griseus TaxID=10029 RepID=G3HVE5_CRIGR|nr:hypothetical protein I79_014932 [Cricetulus griseus]